MILLQAHIIDCSQEKRNTIKLGAASLGSTLFFGALTINCLGGYTCNAQDSRNLAFCTVASGAVAFLCLMSLCDNNRPQPRASSR